MANTIIHKHSSVITDGQAKLPEKHQLEYGEIAINYAKGVETISFKNTENEIVEIKSSNYLEKIIEENEKIVASSLTDLDGRLNATQEITDSLQNQLTDIQNDIIENEETIALAITNLDESVQLLNEEISKIDTGSINRIEELASAIAAETTTRENADNAINAKFGTGIGTGANEKTVAAAIATETTARENADKVINDKIGNGFSSSNTVAKAINDEKTARETADNAINAKFGTGIGTGANEKTVANAIADAVAAEKARAEGAEGNLTTLINTIVDKDTGKSMREVATDEVAKIVDGAPTTFDTLKEIADWIGDDTDGATKMVTDINELKSIVDGFSEENTIKVAIDKINEDIIENEETIALAITNLDESVQLINEGIAEKEYAIALAVSNLDENVENIANNVNNIDVKYQEAINTLHQGIKDSEYTIAVATSDLNNRIVNLNSHIEDIELTTASTLAEFNNKLSIRLMEVNSGLITMQPNIYYRVTEPQTTVLLDLVEPTDTTIVNQYMVEFTTAYSGCSLALIDTVKWLNGITPTIEPNVTYQLSIINNLAVITKFK